MPPKKKADAPSKKTVEKKKEKVIEVKNLLCFSISNCAYSGNVSAAVMQPLGWCNYRVVDTSVPLQDKTFGLKNKKGKKQQQFIKNVTSQVTTIYAITIIIMDWLQVKYGGTVSKEKVCI